MTSDAGIVGPTLASPDGWARYPMRPYPKPRQTRRDKWRPSPAVLKYRAFADEVRLRGISIPSAGAWIVFDVEMPRSWSAAKRADLRFTAHQTRPDADNLFKALADAIYGEDCHLWDYRITKRWSDAAAIWVGSIGNG